MVLLRSPTPLVPLLHANMSGLREIKRRQLVLPFGCHLCSEVIRILKSSSTNIVHFVNHQISHLPFEPRHIVLTRSPGFALSRCLIHILPLTVGLFLIVINLKGFYIGQHLLRTHGSNDADSVGLALIQVAAKVQVSESRRPVLEGI